MFRFALSKGRILEQTLPLLAKLGLEMDDDPQSTRKLIIPARLPANPALNQAAMALEMVVLRATDVPTFVQHGAADFGVVGKDILLEHGADGIYELLDLKIANCRLMVAELAKTHQMDRSLPQERPLQPLKVATKFVNIARRYYANKGQQVKLIKLYGSMELAPLVNMADKIVDLVDTGKTLAANGLIASEHILDVSTRLIVNSASYQRNHQQVRAFAAAIEAQLTGAKHKE